MSIIEVKHLTKEFNLGAVTSIKDTIRHGIARITGKQTWDREKLRALNDVSFSIDEGEVVGIIGHNGAGKSTLLKHLAHITNPTSGEVHVHGSVAPLIEVGAGINPELTARENIFLNGAILGIAKKTIKGKLDEIIDFSELGRFIDTPVKRYSSGMKVKLGFSIATSMNADILIIDEVLAVGDLAFQRKCFDRMEDIIKRQNKTVLIVSHNIRQIVRLCDRVLMLSKGEIVDDGLPEVVCDKYYEFSNSVIKQEKKDLPEQDNEVCELVDMQLTSQNKGGIVSGCALGARILLKIHKTIVKPEIVVGTHTTDFVYLTSNSTDQDVKMERLEPGTYEIVCTWPHFPVKPGPYCFRVVVFNEIRGAVFNQENLCMFKVKPAESESNKPPLRLLDIPVKWAIENKKQK